jgi:hypothetical protein
MDDTEVKILISAIDNYSKQLKDANGKIKELSTGVNEAGKAFSGMSVLSTNALLDIGYKILDIGGKLYDFGKILFEASADAETANLALEVSFENAGLAVGNNIEIFKRLSEQVQKNSIYSKEESERVLALAASFGFSADQLQKLLPILTDVGAKGTLLTGKIVSLESALRAMQMGAEGSERALRQFGIQLTPAQTEMIKTADEGDRLGLIMDIVGDKALGMSDKLSTTATGGVEKLKNSWNDMLTELTSSEGWSVMMTAASIPINNLAESIKANKEQTTGYSIAVHNLNQEFLSGKISFLEYYNTLPKLNREMNILNAEYIEAQGTFYNFGMFLDGLNQQTIDYTSSVNDLTDASNTNSKSIISESISFKQLQDKITEQKGAIQNLLLTRGQSTVLTEVERQLLVKLQADLEKTTSKYNEITAATDRFVASATKANGFLSNSGFTGKIEGWKPGGGTFDIPGFGKITVPDQSKGSIDLGKNPIKKVHDFMITPGGETLKISPRDTIVGFEDSSKFGNGKSININIGNIYGLDPDNIALALQNQLNTMI